MASLNQTADALTKLVLKWDRSNLWIWLVTILIMPLVCIGATRQPERLNHTHPKEKVETTSYGRKLAKVITSNG
jgi:hypothetical protein